MKKSQMCKNICILGEHCEIWSTAVSLAQLLHYWMPERGISWFICMGSLNIYRVFLCFKHFLLKRSAWNSTLCVLKSRAFWLPIHANTHLSHPTECSVNISEIKIFTLFRDAAHLNSSALPLCLTICTTEESVREHSIYSGKIRNGISTNFWNKQEKAYWNTQR